MVYETVKNQREEKQTSMISGQFFYFNIFQTCGNLEIDLMVANQTHVSDKLSILLELRYLFVKILTNYKTDLKHAVTMPLHQGILPDMHL